MWENPEIRARIEKMNDTIQKLIWTVFKRQRDPKCFEIGDCALIVWIALRRLLEYASTTGLMPIDILERVDTHSLSEYWQSRFWDYVSEESHTLRQQLTTYVDVDPKTNKTKRRKIPTVLSLEAMIVGANSVSESTDVESCVEEALKRLPEDLRRIAHHRMYSDQSAADFASTQKWTRNTYYHKFKRLKEVLPGLIEEIVNERSESATHHVETERKDDEPVDGSESRARKPR